MRFLRALLGALVALGLVACGDDSSSSSTTVDMGVGMVDLGGPDIPIGDPDLGGVDAGTPEFDTPQLVDLVDVAPSPYVGSTENERDTQIFVIWNECMRLDSGTIILQPGGIELRVDSPDTVVRGATDLGDGYIDGVIGRENFEADPGRYQNIAFNFVPPDLLTGGVEYEAFIQADWQDCDDGNAPFADDPLANWTFSILDTQRPTMTTSTPMEDPDCRSPLDASSVTEICLTFDEPMNFDEGSVRLEGGRGELLDDAGVVDVLTNTVCYPINVRVEPLANERNYRLRVDGFQDQSGNFLNPVPYMGNGIVEFCTGPDMRGPEVVTSLPLEGQTGVNPATDNITLTFNEDMDTTSGLTNVFFSDGTTTTPIRCDASCWIDDRTIVYPVTDLITDLGPWVLDMSATEFRDDSEAGNVWDGTPYLGDSALNFEVGEDIFQPTVASCTPDEGATGIPFSTGTIRCRFDEPMLTAVESVTLEDGTVVSGRSSVSLSDGISDPIALAGVWSAADSIIEFNVFGRLRAGFTYTVAFDGFADKGGNPLDGTVYLGDGALDFTTEDPSGDTCRDPLTIPLADVDTDGTLVWEIPSRTFADNDGTDTCDNDGGANGGASQDVVIEYIKTSGTLDSGGALLEIDIQNNGSSTTDINWEVRTGSCEPPEDDIDDGNQIYCQWETQTGLQALDLPAGTYYIWVARDLTGEFPGATVRVRETTEYPEGEGCENPWTVDTSVPAAYLAPILPGDPHIFQIPPSAARGFDRDSVTGGAGEMSCVPNPHGNDQVIEFNSTGLSILDIRVTPFDIRFSARDLSVEVQVGCDGAS
ncbi:MAG: Ig-like domain-containing protein, partial [Myxococcota bacterium]